METVNENILGYEKIGKLMVKFSIPGIISLLVNSLYNMVDQVFIGHGVGWQGNGATNVVFPITMICLAVSVMLGDGTASYLSLRLGENEQEQATKGVANGILMSVIASVLLCAVSLLFLPQLLPLFGCTDSLRPYALDYGYVISMGIPFFMMGTVLNTIIRADGSPKYAMITMILGAVLNVVLDPLFIFVFHMGIKGAALATIISQFLTFALAVGKALKFQSVTLHRNSFRFQKASALRVVTLGLSSFITQMCVVALMTVFNNLLKIYGEQSKYGPDIPLTVMGIVMKVFQLMNSVLIGIAAGAQPILGYNYGAKNYGRVKKTLKLILTSSLIVSTVSFAVFQLFPNQLTLIFGSGDANYMEFACKAFRIYLMLCILHGVLTPAGIYFQAIGKSFLSAILPLVRQFVFTIPALFLMGRFFGIDGLLYAGPVADGLAFLLTGTLLIRETRNIGKENTSGSAVTHSGEAVGQPDRHIVITVAREYGSGGRYVGKLIAEQLGIKLYDKDFITLVAAETGMSEEYIEHMEQKKEALSKWNQGYYFGLSNADTLFVKESEIIKRLADWESCVIVGRCADYILRNRTDVVRVFIYSDMEDKISRATKIYGLPLAGAKKEIRRVNQLRASHYKHYTERDWTAFENYDICMNSHTLGVEKTAEVICNVIKEKSGLLE